MLSKAHELQNSIPPRHAAVCTFKIREIKNVRKYWRPLKLQTTNKLSLSEHKALLNIVNNKLGIIQETIATRACF